MAIWGKLAGAAAGLLLGGPLGALIGGIAGHYAIDRRRDNGDAGERKLEAPERQVVFTIGVIALGAKMAKADGVVTRDEVAAFKQVFRVPPEELDNVARVFNLAKRDIAGYEAYAAQLAQIFGRRAPILEDVLDGLFHIAKADGAYHSAEGDFLERVARRFGFDKPTFERIRARHVEPEARDPYLILGIERGADAEEIKRTYRKLVRDNHPDRLIARGVPEEFVVIANERLARINEAYDRLRKERGFT